MSDGGESETPFDGQALPIMDSLDLDNPFWQFSITVYASEPVRDVCLQSQDRHGVDVNLLLLCCWLGFAGVRLDGKGLRRLDLLVDGWRKEVIAPIRTLRRRLADAIGPMGPHLTQPLRQDVKDVELQAERIQQALLFRALENLPGRDARNAERSGVARINLTVYLRDILGIDDLSVLKTTVEAMVIACRDVLEGDDDDNA